MFDGARFELIISMANHPINVYRRNPSKKDFKTRLTSLKLLTLDIQHAKLNVPSFDVPEL